jgi:hypothetical protein
VRGPRRGIWPFGTVDSFLIWKLTGGKVHATDATNAARTLIYNIAKGEWDAEICGLLDIPMSILPDVKDCAADFGSTRADLFGRENSDPWRCRRSAGRNGGSGLFPPRHDEIHLWHGVFCPSEHRGAHGAVETNRLLTTIAYRLNGQHHLCAGRVDLHRRGRGAMAARRAEDYPRGQRNPSAWPMPPILRRMSFWCPPLRVLARPIGGPIAGVRFMGLTAQFRPGRAGAGGAWKAWAIRRAIFWRRCASDWGTSLPKVSCAWMEA